MRNPFKPNKIYTIGNRIFECYVNSEGGAWASVSVWEVVRPTWIFFRTKYYDSKYFRIDKYDSIEMGVLDSLQYLLEVEYEQNQRIAKWKEFEGR